MVRLRTTGKVRGFTTIELIVSSVILGMVIIVSFAFWQYFNESYNFSLGKSVSLSDASRVTAQIVRELREMQVADNGAYPLTMAEDQELGFYADTDEDGQAERIRYWLDQTSLMRGVIEPIGDPPVYDEGAETTKVLIEGVVNGGGPLFYYYNNNWPVDRVDNPLQTNRLTRTTMVQVSLSVMAEVDKTATASTITNSATLRRLIE